MSTTLEQQLVTGLLANAAVAAFLGTRLWAIGAPPPPTNYPSAVLQRISSPGFVFTQDATGAAQGSVGWARVQITIYSQTGIVQAAQIAKAIATAFQGFSCFWAPTSPPTPPPNTANFVLNQTSGRNAETQPPLYWMRMDVKVWYQDQ